MRFTNHYKMRNIYAKTLRINKAVAAIQKGEFIYYENAANYYNCLYSAVSRQIRGFIKFKKNTNSFWH
jgi:hypothetical protein